jgi:hypothetical protein
MEIPDKGVDEISEPPFTARSGEGLVIGVPIGIALLILGDGSVSASGYLRDFCSYALRPESSVA